MAAMQTTDGARSASLPLSSAPAVILNCDKSSPSASVPVAPPPPPPSSSSSSSSPSSSSQMRSGSVDTNVDSVNNSTPVVMPNSMPSFFANPFMTPFMPQQAAASSMGSTTAAAVAAAAAASGAPGTAGVLPATGQTDGGGGAEYRSNPLQADNYLLQSLQCQEMMQHYIQSLMAAAARLPSSSGSSSTNISDGTIRVPDDDQGQCCASGGDPGRFQLEFPNTLPVLIQSMQQQLHLNSPATANPVPVDPVSASAPSVSSAAPAQPPPSPVQDEVCEPNATAPGPSVVDEKEIRVGETEEDSRNDDGTATVTETAQETEQMNGRYAQSINLQESITETEEEDIQENDNIPLSNELVTATNDIATCSNNTDDNEIQPSEKMEGNPENQKKESPQPSNSSSKVTGPATAATSSGDSSSLSKNKRESLAASENNATTIHDECRTSVLIKKQMTEIDKEIHRRIQNKNIKKSALPFGIGETRKASSSSSNSSPKPSLEQLRNSFALPAVPSNPNPSSTISALPSAYLQDQYQQQQQQHCPAPPYFGMPGGMLPDPAILPSQNRCSPSLPTTVEHFTQAGAAAAAAAALGSMPQAYPQFQPYFPPPHAFYFPGAQQHVSPQLAAAILQQFQHGQALNMFPAVPPTSATAGTFSFPAAAAAAAQSSLPTINGNNNNNNNPQLVENGQHLEMVSSMQGNTIAATASTPQASSTIGTNSNGNCLDPKIPPPPAAPTSNSVRRRSLSQNGLETAPVATTTQDGQRQQPKFSQTASQNASGWPGESGWIENGKRSSPSRESTMKNGHAEGESTADGEPVWVMRDSYLKRIQREEDRSNEQQQQQIMEMNKTPEKTEPAHEEQINETESLLSKDEQGGDDENKTKKGSKKEVIVHEPAVLIEGVLFRARYLGSTQLLCEGRPTKASRMMQAQEAVARVKAPAGEIQPSTDIDLFISTEKIMVLNTDLQRISDTDVRQDILMDHALRTISYIADIGDLVVLMARRMSQSAKEETFTVSTPRVICHVFESDEASFIAQSIGQAFQVAYVEFLRANGIDDPSYLREIDYQEVLNSQELMGDELEMFARKEAQKDVVVPKKAGEPLGIVVVESGWGSMLPTVVIANLQPNGAASRCNHLNIGDQIIAINGISLVGLPLASAQQNIKATKSATAVRLTVVSTPPVVEVRIKRPDTKYQLGFSVQNGVICSLLRGGIAERGGIRVGHRIIEINSQSVVAVPHEKIVNMLATAIGEIHMKTMPTSMFRLLTGQEVPNYI